MTVAEMLDRIDSHELAEWMAYEKAFGPLGNVWRDETLAAVHEQLQLVAQLLGGQYEKNPAPEFRRVPRPHEVGLPQDDDD